MSRRRHPPWRWLQSANPRKMCGNSYRAAAVAPYTSRRTPRSNRRRFPSARSAGCPLQIPRAIRPPVKRIVRLISHQKFRHIRIAKQNCPSCSQPRNQRRVLGRNETLPQTAPTLARPPRHFHRTLHRNRHAMQRTQRISTRVRPNRGLRNLGLRARPIHIHMYKRIQLRFAAAIQFRDPRQMRIDKLHGRNSPRPNLLSHLHSRKKIQFIHSELNKNHANAPASLARTPSPHALQGFDFVAAHFSAPSPSWQPPIED